MLKRLDLLLWLLIAIVLSRLVSMAILPMIGTSEARYAEIARIMAETGDWITPWFDYGVPFWGKPPLSFWLEAMSFRLFGVSEFAARLPSWLVNIGVLALIYNVTRNIAGHRRALGAALIYSTMALSFMMSGAVLTDPFLVLGTTLSLVSIILALRTSHSKWRWYFFVGLAIGLLAKGPLALVLVGGPLFVWVLWRRKWSDLYRRIPWFRGLVLSAIIATPWYIVAELKTPGFINYFIVGEHFLRFVDSGWSGDLYGTAHKQTYGTIWLYWLWATFPWGLIAIAILLRHFSLKTTKQKLNDEQSLLLISVLFPSLFFTFSGNILWTYQLPALIPLAILIAVLKPNLVSATSFAKLSRITVIACVPFLTLLIGFYGFYYPDKLKTEKPIVAYYDKLSKTPALIYIDKSPFSARFYSKGRVTTMTLPEVQALLNEGNNLTYYLAVPSGRLEDVIPALPGNVSVVVTNKRYSLLKIIR